MFKKRFSCFASFITGSFNTFGYSMWSTTENSNIPDLQNKQKLKSFFLKKNSYSQLSLTNPDQMYFRFCRLSDKNFWYRAKNFHDYIDLKLNDDVPSGPLVLILSIPLKDESLTMTNRENCYISEFKDPEM